MTFVHKSLLNGNDRILLYLLGHPFKLQDLEKYGETPNFLTQKEIANAAFIERHHITYNLKKLETQRLIESILARVRGKKRKQMAYYLTNTGLNRSKEIKEKLRTMDITLLEPDRKNVKLKFINVTKYLKENGISQINSDLELTKLINHKGILDVQVFSRINKRYVDFTETAFKPLYFYGRDKELIQLRSWIDEKGLYRFVIIQGIAGIGKTTLTSKLIEGYRSSKHLFWHNLNRWDTVRSVLLHLTEFLSAVLKKDFNLFIDFNKPLDIDGILILLKEKLNNLNAILIFDDFHKVKGELQEFFASLIVTLKNTENVKFIILTRHDNPFYDQQNVLIDKTVAELEIGGLDFRSSVKILRRKYLQEIKFKKIYDITSGHPLLLEIIESDRKVWHYIYEEIFSKLSESEQKIMEYLSIYREPIEFDAFFLDDTIMPGSIEDLVKKLIIKESSDGLYDTHEFVKEFFYKRLTPQTRCRCHELCAVYYLQRKEPINLVEAIFHYIKSQQFKIALAITFEKAEKIISSGFSDKFYMVLEELPEEQVALPQWINIILLKGQLCFVNGEWDKALRYYHRAVEVGSEIGQDDIKAKATCEIGHILEEQDKYDDALKYFQKSLELSKQVDDIGLQGEATRGIGGIYWRKSDYGAAEKFYKQSIMILRKSSDSKLIGAIHTDLGNINFLRDNNHQAIKNLKKSLRYLRKTNDGFEIARAYNILGTISTSTGNYKEAIEYHRKQIEIAETIGDLRNLGYGLSNSAYCYAKINKIEKAEDQVKDAKEIIRIINNEKIRSSIFLTTGLINKHYENWEKAIYYFNKSITIITKINVPYYMGEALYNLVLIYEQKGNPNNAIKYYQEARSVYHNAYSRIPKYLNAKIRRIS